VADSALDTHEDGAEAFLVASMILALVSVVGFAGGVAGKAGRFLAGAGSLALMIMVAQVGHSGGQLVYRHGAAAAYADPIR
jgi:hypothetical protein